jgi:hypothetical protein
MKTKILISALGLGLMMSSTSCTEFKHDSWNSIVSSTFIVQSEDEVGYLVGNAYVPWRRAMLLFDGIVRTQQLTADSDLIPFRYGIGWDDGGLYQRLHFHTWTVQDNAPREAWNLTYGGINVCNRLLGDIESGKMPVQETIKPGLISELRVLRASYYYLLLDLFGNVPIVTSFEDTNPQQSTRRQVFDFVVKEITDNVANLSEIPRGDSYGRINKWAAYGFLAKVYLNAEAWVGEAMYDKAIAACDQIITFAESSGEYAMEANQKDAFRTNNENSKELIFALPMDNKYTTDWNAFDVHMQALAPESQVTYKLTHRPWGGSAVMPQFYASFDDDDLRKKENFIAGPQFTSIGGSEPLYNSTNAGLWAPEKKQIDYHNHIPNIRYALVDDGVRWGKFEYEVGTNNILSNDFPVIRYTDVLMMKAESMMRTGKSGFGAIVTLIRERYFRSAPEKAAVTDADLMGPSTYDYGRRDETRVLDDGTTDWTGKVTHEGGADIQYGRFLDELGWEFTQEGRRRQDMIRFGAFTTKSWLSHDASNDPNRNLLPIPTTALNTNRNLKQNPGY